MNAAEKITWKPLCEVTDLIENSGICAYFEGQQIAIFYLPNQTPNIYGLGNWDPIGKANVLSRGIVGDLNGNLVVASPLYKQHFDLTTGVCLEDEEQSVPTYSLQIEGGQVLVAPRQ